MITASTRRWSSSVSGILMREGLAGLLERGYHVILGDDESRAALLALGHGRSMP